MRLRDSSSDDMADDQDPRVLYLAGQIARLRRATDHGPLADLARARAVIRALDNYASEQAQGKPRRRASAAPEGSALPASA